MSGRAARRVSCIAVAAVAWAVAAGPGHANPQVTARPVSTLDPKGTAELWHRLIQRPTRFRRAADCRPLRGVFYAQTDWLRLATKLAQNASPCAEYYVSVPPLVSDKTKLRSDQAFRIRALGTNFHALAEIHWTGWSGWVAANGGSWFAAGVEARRRMAAAGFDVSKGDTWAVNEFPSSVRVGTGAARQNARDFVRGLSTGDGSPLVKGVVFIVGVGQSVPDTTLYRTNLQNWLTDSAFWTDMSAYVTDWSQEVYPDVRRFAVPGAPIQTRRDYLNDYLQHERVLAGVGPPPIDTARAYVQSAYSPLANAAWQWDFGYGWTMVPFDLMQSFVSAQTYALRSFSVATGQALDHWGFAWAPRNATGLSSSDFTSQSGAILDRLGAAIRDSGALSNPGDPGVEACTNTCTGDLPGAAFTELWKSFRTWTQPVLTFTTPPQTIAAGTPSGPLSLALVTSLGTPQIATSPVAVAISSSSPAGQFSLSPTGPWSPTLTLTIAAGTNAVGPFYYQDTHAGMPLLTAAASAVTSGTQTETVLPGEPAGITVAPASATVKAGKTQAFTANGVDSFGNVFPVTAAWTVDPAALGKAKPGTGPTTTFTAGRQGGTGRVIATAGALSGSATVKVKPGTVTVASIRYGIGRDALLVTATLIDSSRRPVAGALVSVLVRRDGYRWFNGRATTTSNGRAIFHVRPSHGCYRTAVTGAAGPGYTWQRGTPRNRFCK